MANEFRSEADEFRDERHESPVPDLTQRFPPLPAWLARRWLLPDEKVTWVRGPWTNPSWERYLTHPALFLHAVALGGIFFAVGYVVSGMPPELPMLPTVGAAAIIIGSIFVLGFLSGHFTRLVVTDRRLLILQGYERSHCWSIDELPLSLIRYTWIADGEKKRTVDLDAVKDMLGGGSDQIADANAIKSFGKQLGQIRARDERREE